MSAVMWFSSMRALRSTFVRLSVSAVVVQIPTAPQAPMDTIKDALASKLTRERELIIEILKSEFEVN